MGNLKDAINDAEVAGTHYTRPEGGLECFQAFNLKYGDRAAIYAAMFNVEKYIFRHDIKHATADAMVKDLNKASKYIEFMIAIYKRQILED